MRLIQFYDYVDHNPVWVNPNRVAWLCGDLERDNVVQIWFSAQVSDDIEDYILVLGSLPTVVEKFKETENSL